MRVSKTSPPQKLASAIAQELKAQPHHPIILRAIGAGAVNQAIKALAIARGFVATGANDLVVRPGFDKAAGDEQEVTAIVLVASLMR